MIEFFPSRQIIVSVGVFNIRWYGLMYVLGFLAVYFLGQRLQKYRFLHLTKDQWLTLILAGAVGVVVGGRLGYVLFYEPGYYAQHLGEVFLLSQGGMSAHGGVIGAIVATENLARKFRDGPSATHSLLFWNLADILVIPAALGLALGRVGNFINQEIYGTVTTLPWGVPIPGVTGLRHPWPLYEALTNIALAFIGYRFLRRSKLPPGIIAVGFVLAHSLIRFGLEYIREPEWPLVYVGSLVLTRGQVLSLPIVVTGAFLMLWLLRPSQNSTSG